MFWYSASKDGEDHQGLVLDELGTFQPFATVTFQAIFGSAHETFGRGSFFAVSVSANRRLGRDNGPKLFENLRFGGAGQHARFVKGFTTGLRGKSRWHAFQTNNCRSNVDSNNHPYDENPHLTHSLIQTGANTLSREGVVASNYGKLME
ncbi:MAG: hypothetical protein AAF393_16425 [Pseudomonadota bacterium]